MKILINGTEIDVTSINITTDDVDSVDIVKPMPAPIDPIEPDIPSTPDITGNTGAQQRKVFDADLSESFLRSTPTNPVFPMGMSDCLDIEYLGSFRIDHHDDVSRSDYATGRIGLGRNGTSMFLAGHDHNDAICEVKIPDLVITDDVKKVNNAPVLQNYSQFMFSGNDPDGQDNDRINGIHVIDDKLYVTSEIWYDAGGKNEDNLQIGDAYNIADIDKTDFKSIEGNALMAGYISDIPEDCQDLLGGKYLCGWASNGSIVSRYSNGPSLAVFDPEEYRTNVKMLWQFNKHQMAPRGSQMTDDNPDFLWNALSNASYAFIVPNSKILVVVGVGAGYHSGIIYKTDPRYPDKVCHGSCPPDATDNYNTFWLFDIEKIAAQEKPYNTLPFSYGKWSHPFDRDSSSVKGAAYDQDRQILYVCLAGGGQTGQYDFTPMINAYKIKAKT